MTDVLFPLNTPLRDAKTDLVFEIRSDPQKGGGRGLYSHNRTTIPTNTIVCSYSKSLVFHPHAAAEMQPQNEQECMYDVYWNTNYYVTPSSVRVMELDEDRERVWNLGIISNCITSCRREKSNTKLCISYRNKSITLKSTRPIHFHDEIITAYGSGLTRDINKQYHPHPRSS